MITLTVLTIWTLAGLWCWMHVLWFSGRRGDSPWLILLACLLGGPAVWLIIVFANIYHVHTVLVGTPEPPKPQPRVTERSGWFNPSSTSRN
jgi:hypothetical protein